MSDRSAEIGAGEGEGDDREELFPQVEKIGACNAERDGPDDDGDGRGD